MTKNPIINALAATGYISILVTAVYYSPKVEDHLLGSFVTLIPIAMLSLLVLSVAVMGYLFFFEPFKLYFDGKREEAVNLFLKTVGVFAFFTEVIFVSILAMSL